MFYILIQPNQEPVYPYTLTDLKRANRDVSFPKDMSNVDATPWHCYPVQPTEQPEAPGQLAARAAPELVDGVWYERWTLKDAPPSPVPDSVTMRQARLALLDAGLLGAVELALADIPDQKQRQDAQITWEYSTEVQRDNSLVSLLAAGLGLSDTDIDNLFFTAASL